MLTTQQKTLRRFWYATTPVSHLAQGPRPFRLMNGDEIVQAVEVVVGATAQFADIDGFADQHGDLRVVGAAAITGEPGDEYAGKHRHQKGNKKFLVRMDIGAPFFSLADWEAASRLSRPSAT